MNRKGIGYEFMFWAARFALLIVVLVSIIWLISAFTSVKVDTAGLESEIILNRLMLGISSEDVLIDRYYPYVVDLSKLEEDFLKQVFTDEYGRFALNLLLVNENGGTLKEIFFNKFLYDIGKPLDWSNKYKSFITNNYVLVRDGDKLQKGFLSVIVVMPQGGGLKIAKSSQKE